MIGFRLLVGSFDGLLSCKLDEPESAADLPVEPESAELKLTLLVATLEVQDTAGDFMQPPMTPAFPVVVLGGSHSFRRRRLSCPSLPAEPTEGAESTEGAANLPRPDRALRRSGVASMPISLPTRSDDASSIPSERVALRRHVHGNTLHKAVDKAACGRKEFWTRTHGTRRRQNRLTTNST
jgi:hypothetical protein